MTLTQVFKLYKYSISIVLSFVLLENIAWVIEPTFFGRLLDALIDKFYDKEKIDYFSPLFIWIIVYLLNVLGGALSRYYGGKIYARIYAEIATRVIIHSQHRNHTLSKTLARAELAKGYMVFLKERLPEVTWQFTASVGTMIALFFYDWRIAGVGALVILPIIYINKIYKKNVGGLQKNIHDKNEDLFKLTEEKDSTKIHDYYHSMVSPETAIAKWNTSYYSVIKVLLMIIFIAVLFICVDVDRFSTGKIYSIVAYLWTFIGSTEYIPGLMESLASVKDLSTRLSEEEV